MKYILGGLAFCGSHNNLCMPQKGNHFPCKPQESIQISRKLNQLALSHSPNIQGTFICRYVGIIIVVSIYRYTYVHTISTLQKVVLHYICMYIPRCVHFAHILLWYKSPTIVINHLDDRLVDHFHHVLIHITNYELCNILCLNEQTYTLFYLYPTNTAASLCKHYC